MTAEVKSEESTKNVDETNPVTEEDTRINNSGSNDVANDISQKVISPSVEEKLASKMFSCSRETLCLFLVIMGLTFAALHNAPPKISKPPPARPFFNQSSIVIDFYKGQLNAMIERASDSDVCFVMYYAPWDAESQSVREEFERVAQYYHSQIFFAAINCWHPGSECRQQYNKIQSYPVLFIYPHRGSGVQYRGINEAPYIMRFLDTFLKPIHRISRQEELMELLLKHESVMVGFFEFEGLTVSPGYKEFYKTAIRALERDPNRDTAFAVVTDQHTASKEFYIEYVPAIVLYLWNESLIYPQEKLWTVNNILRWKDEYNHKVSAWLQPPGVKSKTLSPYFKDNPVLLLFTPRNPLHSSNYHKNLIREVALEYNNCGNSYQTNRLLERLRKKRQYAKEKYRIKMNECSQLLAGSKSQPMVSPVSISIQKWINESCCAKIFMNKCLLCKDDSSDGKICSVSDKFSRMCEKKDIFKRITEQSNEENDYFCCNSYSGSNERPASVSKVNSKYKTSMITPENDSRSAIAVRRHTIENDCVKFLAGDKYHYAIFPDESDQKSDVKLTESVCNVNRTLAFIAVDSLQYFHFAEGLGLDVLKMRDKTAVVILDTLQESQYLMQQNLNKNNLIKFINNYTTGSLQRKLRSDSSKRYAEDFEKKSKCINTPSTICVEELNTDTFLPTVLDPTKDVVVMYHSPYCAFCSAIYYVFLTLAHLLSNVDQISFVRIDGDNNDLPWEYTINRFPSILFFPAKKKEDSTIFPSNLPITIPNLLSFVLSNLEQDTHIEALLNVCHIGAGESPEKCVSRIRRYCLDTIQNYLHAYRKLLRQQQGNDNNKNINDDNDDDDDDGNSDVLFKRQIAKKKREILLKLEHVRDVHLLLSTIEDLQNEGDKYKELVKKFRTYRSNLSSMNRRSKKYRKRKIGNDAVKRDREERIVKDEL
ncbi:thioredoxin domain-containing protein 11 [Microplitis mediator]|uniref:thioredoxin domain-containing protein 11 n=1 Tax=Microplitis mediator TaxID=375433 RepID=UPI0025546951|nr:thioredoxin domain-containing protein 11 [Microplitis mediator]